MWQGKTLTLSGREAHHLSRVLRVTPGATIDLFDGKGHSGRALVARVGRGEVELQLQEKRLAKPPSFQITLGCAIPKGTFEEVIREATQLGAVAILPLVTARGEVKISAQEFSKKKRRFSQIAIESGKQSGVLRLPVLLALSSFRDALATFSQYDLVLMAAVEGPHEKLTTLLANGDIHRVLLLVGPEGDFTPEEMSAASSAGVKRISLGPNILRCKTAAISALSIVSFILREKEAAR